MYFVLGNILNKVSFIILEKDKSQKSTILDLLILDQKGLKFNVYPSCRVKLIYKNSTFSDTKVLGKYIFQKFTLSFMPSIQKGLF